MRIQTDLVILKNNIQNKIQDVCENDSTRLKGFTFAGNKATYEFSHNELSNNLYASDPLTVTVGPTIVIKCMVNYILDYCGSTSEEQDAYEK